MSRHFNPRSPHGERHTASKFAWRCTAFQSTLPARGATRVRVRFDEGAAISIHAPRTGSDTFCSNSASCPTNFNPRSPHGERPQRRALLKYEQAFQSTLPARGATVSSAAGTGKGNTFQSTLPARGATDSHHEALFPAGISIHAPRTGSDLHSTRTPPRRDISIHAPRTGSDRTPPRRDERGGDFNPRSPHGERPFALQTARFLCNFNPRSPHGERRPPRPALAIPTKFQSTLPARGATG